MWKGGEDPDGGPPEGGPSDPQQSEPHLQDLKDQFEQQQLLISQLKEIIKKTDQTTVTQEKVAEYANTLTKMKSRVKRQSINRDVTETDSAKLNTPASERITLLRQQLEENKIKLAERGKSQKGIEEMVAQVKAQFDDSHKQITLSQTPLNISLIEDRVDYSPQLGSQELYNILLNKDKRLNELNTRMSKMQGTILDLQENLKEKDSVIDARTKAITLMTENLSRKGKTTLDALEETKEQMRNMQENFIQIEEQLKSENAILQADLDAKGIELQKVRQENEELLQKNTELKKKETSLQAKLDALEKSASSPTSSPSRRSPSKSRKSKKGKFPSKSENAFSDLEKQLIEKSELCELKDREIDDLKKQCAKIGEQLENINSELEKKEENIQELKKELQNINERKLTDDDSSGDVSKLKMQLDEANKNMIKVKAENKRKIKESNKKIDAFKKVSDVNAELVKVENENSKLQLKIAELEDEKGQLQLTMVDSRESTSLDELEATIEELNAKLAASQAIITQQETEITKHQEEIATLRAKLEQLTSEDVQSQLTTVQFEEQLEHLEKEKANLETSIQSLEEQIAETSNQLEELKKEKSEMQIKYDALLQENAELIDRLEKLSTEKVSSAESIEIVENLTQQEKMEIEAYQKSLLPKTSMENLEDNPELNDSVNQLTEETSELLQKIELFTVERREVMEKLELLTEENNQLNLKLKEVENNRDVLVETYEQLQTEKDVLDSKLEEYEKQVKVVSDQSSEVAEYRDLIAIQKQEVNDLKLKLLSYESHDHKNVGHNEFEDKYMQLLAENEDLLVKIDELGEANKNFIDENKENLTKYSLLLEDNKQLQADHQSLQENFKSVQIKFEELKKKEDNLMNTIDEYETELNEKCSLVKQLENDIKKLNEEKIIIESNLTEREREVESVTKEKQEKQIENEKLLKQASAGSNNETLETKIKELEVKNKEQLEKMKKIAANLKKKTVEYKELEAKYNEMSKIEIEKTQKSSEVEETVHNLKLEFESAQQDLEILQKDYKTKQDECNQLLEQQRVLGQENNQIKTRNEEITTQLQTYSTQIEDLQSIIRENEAQMNIQAREIESLRSKSDNTESEAIIKKLQEEIEALTYNSQTSNNALQMKLHEQEMCIENHEVELQKYKEQVSSLEEGLSNSEDMRQQLEVKARELERTLQERENNFLQAGERHELLEQRIKDLLEKEQLIQLKLEEATEENNNFQRENQQLHGEIDNYKKEINNFNIKLSEYEANKEALAALEAEKQALDVKVKSLENEIKKLNMDLSTIQSETEKNDNELQDQLVHYSNERKHLMDQLEISREEFSILNNQKIEMEQTIADLNLKLDQQQIEFEQTISKYHEVQQEHKKSLANLEQQEATIKMLEEKVRENSTTPEDLQSLLQQKLAQLAEFKATYVPSPADFFSENATEANLNKEIHELQAKIQLKMQQANDSEETKRIRALEEELQQKSITENEIVTKLDHLQRESEVKESKIREYEEKLHELKTQLEFARNMLEQVEETNFQTLDRNNELEKKVQELLQAQSSKESTQNIESDPKQVNLFQWSETSEDPFAFVQGKSEIEETLIQKEVPRVDAASSQDARPITSNTAEELQQKIKTLEFMLFNTEQEKEHALIQCAQLSEELGRFIYEKEQVLSQTNSASSLSTSNINLESQILSSEEISLPIKVPHEESKTPQECFSMATISEESCVQKKAYECTPSAFADDDGWGFDVEEVKMGETRAQPAQASSNSMVAELEEKIRLLQLEKDVHLEEIHQANIKSGKLIKKLKEFKARNEQLVAKIKATKPAASVDDFGLEDAIQEELKSQITMLEKKIKETSVELEKERAEKENHAKRVDVLTSANERLIEMKEKQDIEVLGYQQQARDLQMKLEKVAWSSDTNEQTTSLPAVGDPGQMKATLDENYESKIQELNDTIKELQLDNEELQVMLEDQMKLRKEAESRKSVSSNEINDAQLAQLIEEKTNLVSQIALYENDKETMIVELNSLKDNYSKACEERDGLIEDLKHLNDKLQDNYKEKTMLEATILENGILIESLKKTIDELNLELQTAQNQVPTEDLPALKAKLESVEQINASYENQLMEVRNEKEVIEQSLKTLQAGIEVLESEKSSLQESNKLLDATVQELRDELQQKIAELDKLQRTNESEEALRQEIATLKQELSDQQNEFEQKLSTTTSQLALEWAQHVEQRGNDVAESWKLHVETRETEFMQLEQALRKELYDWEEKHNALVNENNELRRNVDAEIRNEVDRISALQQQINDRQMQVAKLTESAQQKDSEIEQLREERSNLVQQLRDFEERMNAKGEELLQLMQQQEKVDETIESLSAQLQAAQDNKESEELIEKLRTELVAKDNEITKCKSTIDKLAVNLEEHSRIQARLDENTQQLNEFAKEKERNEKLKLKLDETTLQVTTLHGSLQEKQHRLQELEAILHQQQNDDANSKQLQNHVHELQQQIANYAMQLQENNLHINSLNEEIESYKVLSNHLQTKDTEIQRLGQLLEEKQREHEYALEHQLLESQSVLSGQTQELDSLRRLLNQERIARDELITTKDAEIDAYRERAEEINKQLSEYQNEYAQSEGKLAQVGAAISDYEAQIGDYQRQLGELNSIIENQVLKIEELQQEIYEKSRHYDALVAELSEPQELKKKAHFNESASTSSTQLTDEPREDNPADQVSRAELDLALYMLHQRDVRCEELTVELMSLLEERDTLQLRLSNALREKEEIRSRIESSDDAQTATASTSSTSGTTGKTKAIILGATGTEMATEAKEERVEELLATKLSELKVVGYKKDKTLVDEQELRRLQQMAILEQHKDEVSKLPAEAQARLLDASYTLSRDVQSPSKVLLNWLWGKSTPKVNNV